MITLRTHCSPPTLKSCTSSSGRNCPMKFIFLVLLLATRQAAGRVVRNVKTVVVSRAIPSANKAHGMAHNYNAVLSSDDGYIFQRRQRASDGHPVEFYLQTIMQELTNVADGSTDTTIEAQNAAKAVIQLIINDTIDVSSIIKEFPSILQGEPDYQLLKTLKLVRMKSFSKGVELNNYLDVLIEHVKASRAQPGAVSSPVDTLMEHLSRFATSIYEALSRKKVT